MISSIFKVINASTLVSSRALSSVFRTGSLKLIIRPDAMGTSVSPLDGLKVTTGGDTSSVSKVTQV